MIKTFGEICDIESCVGQQMHMLFKHVSSLIPQQSCTLKPKIQHASYKVQVEKIQERPAAEDAEDNLLFLRTLSIQLHLVRGKHEGYAAESHFYEIKQDLPIRSTRIRDVEIQIARCPIIPTQTLKKEKQPESGSDLSTDSDADAKEEEELSKEEEYLKAIDMNLLEWQSLSWREVERKCIDEAEYAANEKEFPPTIVIDFEDTWWNSIRQRLRQKINLSEWPLKSLDGTIWVVMFLLLLLFVFEQRNETTEVEQAKSQEESSFANEKKVEQVTNETDGDVYIPGSDEDIIRDLLIRARVRDRLRCEFLDDVKEDVDDLFNKKDGQFEHTKNPLKAADSKKKKKTKRKNGNAEAIKGQNEPDKTNTETWEEKSAGSASSSSSSSSAYSSLTSEHSSDSDGNAENDEQDQDQDQAEDGKVVASAKEDKKKQRQSRRAKKQEEKQMKLMKLKAKLAKRNLKKQIQPLSLHGPDNDLIEDVQQHESSSGKLDEILVAQSEFSIPYKVNYEITKPPPGLILIGFVFKKGIFLKKKTTYHNKKTDPEEIYGILAVYSDRSLRFIAFNTGAIDKPKPKHLRRPVPVVEDKTITVLSQGVPGDNYNLPALCVASLPVGDFAGAANTDTGSVKVNSQGKGARFRDDSGSMGDCRLVAIRAGGALLKSPCSRVDIFDLEENRWTNLPNMQY
ncbi:hypothetical protein RFI_14108, partial [Reticulomyxa filosa]